MSSLSVFDLLAMHAFVADLPSGSLHQLSTAGRPVFHGVGYRMFREDAVADRFWLLYSGTVAIDFHVPGRGDVVVERVGSGTVVGWSWLRLPSRWRFGAVVAEEIQAVEFDAARVRRLIGEDAELGRELTTRLLDVVADRVDTARHRLLELYAYPRAEPRR